jgi:putative solute:sodium symporter small subunit
MVAAVQGGSRAGGHRVQEAKKGGYAMSNEADNRVIHWHRTKNLMIGHLVVWFFFSFVVHWIAPTLNKVSVFHFPLGFYMAAQGALIAFVVQLFIFTWQQERIDRDCGMAEEQP